jgi:flagellar basal body-associated protein FliL
MPHRETYQQPQGKRNPMHPFLRAILLGFLIELAAALLIAAFFLTLEHQDARAARINQEILHHANRKV